MKKILLLVAYTLCIINTAFTQNNLIAHFDSPPNEAVATPFLYVKVRTETRDTCAIESWFGPPENLKLVFRDWFVSEYDKMIDMSQFNGKVGETSIAVTNKKTGEIAIRTLYSIYVDSSRYLQEYVSVPGRIKDFKDNKILYIDDTSYASIILRDLSTQKDTIVLLDTTGSVYEVTYLVDPMFITPTGITYTGYDWNNNKLYKLGNNNYPWEITTIQKVEGDYGYYYNRNNQYQGLYRRQFSTKTDSLVTKSVTWDPYMIASGDITYSVDVSTPVYGKNIYYYRNGKTTSITNSGVNGGPMTDGSRVVFSKALNNLSYLYLYDGTDSILINVLHPFSILPGGPSVDLTGQAMNKNFIAFIKNNPNDVPSEPSYWLRDNYGNEKQIFNKPFYSFGNWLEKMNDYGDVFLQHNYLYQYYKRYYYNNKTQEEAKEICSALGTLYFQNNTWYLAIGRTLFKVNVGGDVLPLQLTSFSAKRTGKTNLLQWSTTQELNTDRFEIQRSNNSRDFISIGTVKSFNNGKSQNDYTYTDQLPLKATNYYRLKMIEKDGKFTYSAIRNVNNTSSLDISTYPNPVNDVLTLNFNTEKITDVQIDITDINGKKLQSKKVQLPYGASIQTLNVAALRKGTYFVQCTTKDENIGIKFVKQ